MEIQRYGDDHLEIILDAAGKDSQKKEIEALADVVRTWEEKCDTAKSCAVAIAPAEADEIVDLAKRTVKSLNESSGISVKFLSEDKAETDESTDPQKMAEKKSHLKDLVMLAIVDGQFDEEEQKTIIEIGTKMGLTERKVNSIYNESILNPDQIPSVVPEDKEERLKHLANLCRVILADGTIAEWESVLIFPLAVKMGFVSDDVTRMLSKMIDAEL